MKLIKQKDSIGGKLLEKACQNDTFFGSWKQKGCIVVWLEAPDCNLLFATSYIPGKIFSGTLGVEPFTQKPLSNFAGKVSKVFRDRASDWNCEDRMDFEFEDFVQSIYEEVCNVEVNDVYLRTLHSVE